uniref:Syntaxin binding protein 6 n=2 Tax=Neognathae TaxID=8825 RepID=A0A8C3CHT3_CAIMO
RVTPLRSFVRPNSCSRGSALTLPGGAPLSPPCRQVPNSGPSALVFSRGPEPLPVPAAATSTAQRPLSRQFEAGPGRDRGQRRRRGRVPAGRRDSVCRPAGVRRSAGGADWRSRRTWGRPHASALAARRPPPRELRAGGAAPGRGEEGGGTQPSRAERSRHEVTNKKPAQASITKVKQFEGSTSFVRRTQWMLEQLRQVNGIDPNRDSPEFDLLFENAFDQWVASTASEKCTFFQVLHHTCQRYLTDKKPEFINCQSKIMGGNSILHSAADSVTSAVQKASQALNERGERLGRAEEKTEELKNSAQQFAETAHKLAMKHKC